MLATTGSRWDFALFLVLGAAFVAGGIALFRDFRGVASWQSTKTVNLSWPLHRRTRRLPPWRWIPSLLAPTTRKDAIRHQLRVVRFVGAAFTVGGVVLLIVGSIGMSTHRS